jgi:hypothetical protein
MKNFRLQAPRVLASPPLKGPVEVLWNIFQRDRGHGSKNNHFGCFVKTAARLHAAKDKGAVPLPYAGKFRQIPATRCLSANSLFGICGYLSFVKNYGTKGYGFDSLGACHSAGSCQAGGDYGQQAACRKISFLW